MIDHLLRFADEAAAVAACPQFRTPVVDDVPAGWDQSRVIPAVRVFQVTGTETVEVDDGNGGTIEETRDIRAYEPWWYLWIALPAIDDALTAMDACMIVADREAAQRGESYVRALRIPPENLPNYFVEPVMGGSDYPFGAA